MKSNPKIIKVNPNQIMNPLNEDWAATAGFSSSQDFNCSGFSYEIKPLSFTLSQKGNDPVPEDKNKSFKHFVGDYVTGYCPYDGKKHEGMIKYLYWAPESDESVPKLVYVQDFETEDTIPLEGSSIKQSLMRYTPNDLSQKDYFRSRDMETVHDYAASEMPNVFESFDFNDQSQKSYLSSLFDNNKSNFSESTICKNYQNEVVNKLKQDLYFPGLSAKDINVWFKQQNENSLQLGFYIDHAYSSALPIKYTELLYKNISKNQFQIIEPIYLKAGMVFYHGTKTGNLNIDFNKENLIWFTDNIKMAEDYAKLIKKNIDLSTIRSNYRSYMDQNGNVKGETLVKSLNKNRKIIKIKLLKDLKIAKYNAGDPGSEKEMDINRTFNNLINNIREHNLYNYNQANDTIDGLEIERWCLYKYVKDLGYDGICAMEYGKVDFNNQNWAGLDDENATICIGPSLYIFDLKNIEVIENE